MRLRASVLCGAALLVAGCSTTTQGSPVTSSSAPAALFNPCDIPDDALRAAGVDPGTERVGIAGAGFEGWEICSWEATAGWYFLRVYSTDRSLEDMKKNRNLTRFENRTSGSRTGVESVNKGGEAETCNFGFAVQQGLIMVNVVAKSGVPRPEDPCATTLLRTQDLDSSLPN